ncbi:MAG: hypothetical protein IKT12_01260, partial [Thermoguttaceae bacterium]|nr:hypothetical protein [Thermoguttaceae bacterium]
PPPIPNSSPTVRRPAYHHPQFAVLTKSPVKPFTLEKTVKVTCSVFPINVAAAESFHEFFKSSGFVLSAIL